MINRYQGNSGRYTRVEDGHKKAAPAKDWSPSRSGEDKKAQPANTVLQRGGIFEKLSGLLSGGTAPLSSLSQLETEDIILLLILYLMYRESGDSELLMIMGAMFLI